MSLRRARELLDRAEARRLVLPERGVEVALLDWGGAGPLALLHHANGFCKGLWALVAEGLCDRYRVIAMGYDILPIERAVAGMFGGINR